MLFFNGRRYLTLKYFVIVGNDTVFTLPNTIGKQPMLNFCKEYFIYTSEQPFLSNMACVILECQIHVVWFCFHVFQYSLGGPIIAFQVENEYGSYGEHDLSKEYMAYLKTVRQIIT